MNYTKMIHRTEDYIEENLSQKILLADISYNIGMSEFHFHRIFKANSTETIHEFITRIKMERSAMFLLISKSTPITEIAYRYGYDDASSYIRAFKRYFAMTPTQYRKSKK